MAVEVEAHRLYIGGGWQPAKAGETYEREDPATGEPVARFAAAGAEDVDAAVQAARRQYENREWADAPAAAKQAALRGVADWLRAHHDELTQLVSLEAGKPLKWAEFDVVFAAGYFDYYSALVRDICGRTLPGLRPDLFAYTLKEPAGVAGIMTPWNFPLLIAAQKVAPALTAGCSVVLKPAPPTGRTAIELARAFEELDFPAGLVNVVTDAASAAGEALCRHPDVNVISFTGSSATAPKVMAAAAGTLKRVVLEAGGKCPMIVHADADLDAALDVALFAGFFNTGQVCNAASRLFVHADIADAFESRFAEEAQKLKVGSPRDPTTDIGPVISAAHRDRVLSHIDIGVQEGARLLVPGGPASGDGLDNGYYLAPTIFAGVESSMRIGHEEIFGPVVGITRYTDLSDALRDANASPYGLAGAIWSRDADVIQAATRGLQVGMVWVNEFLAVFPETPHGGYGLSGIGREMGPEALAPFQEHKTVIHKHGRREPMMFLGVRSH